MAKEEEKSKQAAEKPVPTDGKKGSPLMLIIILSATVLVCGGGGVAAGLFMSKPTEQPKPPVPTEPNTTTDQLITTPTTEERVDYLIEGVVACLDEPSLSRYVRVSLTLQMTAGFDKENGTKFLDSNQAILRDWLTTYLAGLTLVQVQGSRNLEQIKLEIFEEFNRILFKDKKPLIERILFKEFVVQ